MVFKDKKLSVCQGILLLLLSVVIKNGNGKEILCKLPNLFR